MDWDIRRFIFELGKERQIVVKRKYISLSGDEHIVISRNKASGDEKREDEKKSGGAIENAFGVGKVRESRFPLSLFWIILGSLLVLAGVHIGIILLMQKFEWPAIIQAHVMVFYWLFVAGMLALYVRNTIRKVYDVPLQELSDVTKEVAKGNFDISIEPIHTAEDKIDYLDVMINDLNTMIEELGSIETLKQDFISNVSHELKTPMAVIKNHAELMQTPGCTPERMKEYAGIIEEASVKMTELVSNILRLNRLEHQRIAPELSEVDISRNLCDSIIQFEDRWEKKNIEVDVDVEDRAVSRSDPDMLELVWNNLLSNAIKFTPEGGHIGIRQYSTDNSITVTFTDDGCGMTEETRKHIFDKFYQGDTSHATEGNGLGLALTLRIIRLLDGEISVESEPGKGSCFTVRLKK